jgi:hypothetical protein
MFSCNGIDVIKKLRLCHFGWHRCTFLIEKITFMSFQKNTRKTQGDALAFLKVLNHLLSIKLTPK